VPSLPIHLQLLDYLLQIWEDDLKNKRPLSFVIPIVVYHGDRKWKQKPFSGYFPGLPEDWKVFIPNFHYLLTDLNHMTPREIDDKVGSEYLRNLFLALKFARNEKLILENWLNILTFGEPSYQNTREGILLQTLTLYIFNLFDMTEAKVKTLNKQLPEPERDWIDAIPEIFGRKWKEEGLRKGLEEGREQGREQGIEQGREQGIEQGLEQGREQGLEQGREQGIEQGREQGREQGIEQGREQGIEQGREQAAHAFTIKMIQKFPEVTDAEIAELVNVPNKFVQRVRREVTEKH